MSKKILMIIRGKFPTERAYGVTTMATYQSLMELGYECKIICLQPDLEMKINQSVYKDLIFLKENRLTNFVKIVSFRNTRIINVLAWKIFFLLTVKQIQQFIDFWKPNLIWCRDKPIMIKRGGDFPRPSIVVELHEIPSPRLLKVINSNMENRYILAPISKTIQKRLPECTDLRPVIFSPMGVAPRLKYISKESNPLIQKLTGNGVVSLGYFGRIRPNGYSKGTEDIFGLAELHRNLGLNTEFWFVGLSSDELAQANRELESRGLSQGRVHLQGHIPHEEALFIMERFDVLILTVASSNNYNGFPLKALEYARSGARLLVADAPVNRDVYCGMFQPYWFKPGDIQDLNRAFMESITDPNREKNKDAALNFADEFTWEARTKRILAHAWI